MGASPSRRSLPYLHPHPLISSWCSWQSAVALHKRSAPFTLPFWNVNFPSYRHWPAIISPLFVNQYLRNPNLKGESGFQAVNGKKLPVYQGTKMIKGSTTWSASESFQSPVDYIECHLIEDMLTVTKHEACLQSCSHARSPRFSPRKAQALLCFLLREESRELDCRQPNPLFIYIWMPEKKHTRHGDRLVSHLFSQYFFN